MKKVLNNRLFIFIISGILFTSLGVYATITYKASDIVYNASNGVSMNVNDALNELYKTRKGNYYYYYANGTVVYYNPETNSKCSESEAISTTETKTGCMKWYIFNDSSESDTVNMILDHNTTAIVFYNSGGTNTEMNEVATALENDTSTWNNKLNARLIMADEIAKITGNSNFDSATSTAWFYLDNNTQTQTATKQGASKYHWLFDYTSACTGAGCSIQDNNKYVYSGTSKSTIAGYWTSTPMAGTTNTIWVIDKNGSLWKGGNVSTSTGHGLRPVITVSKSIIS